MYYFGHNKLMDLELHLDLEGIVSTITGLDVVKVEN